jgi:ABC-2 type transport system permease protein
MNGLLAVLRGELHRIFSLRPAFSVLVGAVVIYAVLYPQPYVNEALREVPIAVVDQDGTASSRELARRIDATPDAAIAMVLPDLASAERQVYARNIYGILLIPEGFERDLLHGRSSPVALYADASYFLMNQRVVGGVSGVARTFGAEVETARLIDIGVDPAIASAVVDPMPLTAVPLFNPQGGYATYALPAAFVLILQQTLLIGIGLLGTLPGGNAGARAPVVASAGALATVMGKALAYLVLEAVILPFYLIALPYLYGVPRLGSGATIFVFAIPFVLSVCGLGLVVGATFRTPLSVQLALAAIGLPLFFIAGFSWPSEAMPELVRVFSKLVPSTSAIDGLVRVSQLGAPLADVQIQYLTLWGLAAFYGCIAVALEVGKRRSDGRARETVGSTPESH